MLSEAQKNAGKHEDAIASILEGQKHFSDNQELKDALNLLDPKLSSDIREELYHDPLKSSWKAVPAGKLSIAYQAEKKKYPKESIQDRFRLRETETIL